ncbi:hypothetical protein N7478_000325 [Penicillium angulare]|uniref:uncharacterized protein n=1 Tax=Penicillium angulare TaxID=116970 RepID=UPI0025417E2E|nr:uncharacterized protein N7478_000325 [Penicillium angulare]KAJ5291074.1 hypothetical protein N7478_000325 [Penicillium angulare]
MSSTGKQTSAGMSADIYQPNESLRTSVKVSLAFAFTISTVAVALRIWARKLTGCKLFLDDYLILIALLFKYGCSIGVTMLLFNGLGYHMDIVPEEQIVAYFKIGWANPFVYTPCVAFIKLSVLALYKRLFAVRYMVLACNIMASVVILWTVSILVANTLSCIPIKKSWDMSIDGSCIDMASFYYGMQIPNIVSDLIILVMPIKVVVGLPIAKTQKLLLSCVFLVGGLTFIFDCVRLWVAIQLTKSGPDITYNQAPTAMWTCTESAVGIVGACLPNLRPLFKIGSGNFWSQLRSSRGSSKKGLMNSNTTNTTSTSESSTIAKPHMIDHISEQGTQGIEVHRYSRYAEGEKH